MIDEFRSSFPLEDGMRVMIDLLKSHKHDLQVMCAVFQALAGLTMDLASPTHAPNEENQSKLIVLGVVSLLKEMMINHPSSADLQQSACMMVSALCRRNEINGKLLGESKMNECVISAVKRHVDKPMVQEWALFAVSQLCFDDANRVSIGTEGGIPLILQDMKTYPNHPDLEESMVFLLQLLLRHHWHH